MKFFSPNMLKTFEQCPKKYCFRYIKSLSMPVNDEIFVTGKNIHALASYYLRKENIDKLEPALNEKESLLWNYLKNIEYFSYETVHTEYNLTVNIDGYYFGGRLDALVKNGEGYYILDYKTGSAPKGAELDFQTAVYIMAVSEFLKTNDVTFVYIDLKNKKNTEIKLTQELKEKYSAKLISAAAKINKEDFAPSRRDCNICEYGKICYDKLLD